MAAPVVRIFQTDDYEGEIDRASRTLREGGVVVLPTETVYGGAAALGNKPAVARLRQLVPPAPPGPLVVHLARSEDAQRFLGPVSDLGRRMTRKLWPGPVAITFSVPDERQKQVATELGTDPKELYREGTITLRCPGHAVATDVIGRADVPVVLRRAGGAADAALRAEDAASAWGDLVDLIIDAGPTRYSRPSTIVRVNEAGYEIVRAGVYDQRIIDRFLRTTILFVCSGNTCRSPMAEVITRQMLARKLNVSEDELEKKGINVMSAGTFAVPGARATAAAVEAIRSIGADLSQHRSRPLTVELVHQADVIYTMSRSHVAAVTALVPAAADKVHTLNPDGDIEDPSGGDVRLYHSLAGQLQGLIAKRLDEQSWG